MSLNPMKSYFQMARAAAANISYTGEVGTYTAEMFSEDFPQFFSSDDQKCFVPVGMMQQFILQANDSVLPSRWGINWRYAAGLFIAHQAALYLKTYAPGSASAVQVFGKAAQTGNVKSASMGDTSISYDNSAVTAGTEKWGSWNATEYGQQLVTMARMIGMGGMYVI